MHLYVLNIEFYIKADVPLKLFSLPDGLGISKCIDLMIESFNIYVQENHE